MIGLGDAAGANNIKLYSLWLNFYHGGLDPAKSPMTVYLSNIVVANSFIGPGVFSGSVQPDTTVPAITLTAPNSGATVSGSSVSLSANATDNIAVTGVRFYIDGNPVGSEDSSSPFGITWDSTSVTLGTHTLTAVARDGAGNTTTSASRSFTVAQVSGDSGGNIDSGSSSSGSSSHKSSSKSSKKKKTTKPFSISQSSSSLTRGSVLVQRGKKFSKSNTVQLFFETRPGSFGKQILRTDVKGKFITSFRVNKPAGIYRWYAVDTKTGRKSASRWYKVR